MRGPGEERLPHLLDLDRWRGLQFAGDHESGPSSLNDSTVVREFLCKVLCVHCVGFPTLFWSDSARRIWSSRSASSGSIISPLLNTHGSKTPCSRYPMSASIRIA